MSRAGGDDDGGVSMAIVDQMALFAHIRARGRNFSQKSHRGCMENTIPHAHSMRLLPIPSLGGRHRCNNGAIEGGVVSWG